MTTTTRLLTLLSLLQTRRDWQGSVLASRLEVSDRTVRRDIERLRDMGYTIHTTMGPEGGYRLDAGDELPPLLFDDDQAVAIAIALQAAPESSAGIEEASVRALATIRQVMPPRLRHRLDALRVRVVGRAGDGGRVEVSVDALIALAEAIRAQQVIRFDYRRSAESEDEPGFGPPRHAEPHHLVTSQGRWYLVAWDLERDDWRLYRADRLRLRIPNGPRFERRAVPGGDVDDFVAARFKGSDVNEWACRGSVILHLPARDVVPFAGDGTVTVIDEERCRLDAGAWSWGSAGRLVRKVRGENGCHRAAGTRRGIRDARCAVPGGE